MGCHNHISQLERAIYDEVERRISSEDQIREQVDAKLKISHDRLSTHVDAEIARFYRRIDADISNRFDVQMRQVASISNTLTQLARKVERLTIDIHQSQDRIGRTEKVLESFVSSLPGNTAGIKQGISTSSEMPLEPIPSGSADQVSLRISERLSIVEDWLKTSLGPEILRVKESIRDEKTQREEGDEEIMAILSQYTDIMRRHLDSFNREVKSHNRVHDEDATEIKD